MWPLEPWPLDPPKDPPPPKKKQCCCAIDIKVVPKGLRLIEYNEGGKKTGAVRAVMLFELEIEEENKEWDKEDDSECVLEYWVRTRDGTGDYKGLNKDWEDEMKQPEQEGGSFKTREDYKNRNKGLGRQKLPTSDMPGPLLQDEKQKKYSGHLRMDYIATLRSSVDPCECDKRSVTVLFHALFDVNNNKVDPAKTRSDHGDVSGGWPPGHFTAGADMLPQTVKKYYRDGKGRPMGYELLK